LGENGASAQEIARLQKLLEDAVRKRKRNTAPFSRDNPKPAHSGKWQLAET